MNKELKNIERYVLLPHGTKVYHAVVLYKASGKNDKTFCGWDLSTRDEISIWKTLAQDNIFLDQPPIGLRLCKYCERRMKKEGYL